jgi:hypothetical protein
VVDRVQPGRDEVAALQPIASSLVNVPVPMRVFEMIRLLSTVDCYRVTAGSPDDTAVALEDVILRSTV